MELLPAILIVGFGTDTYLRSKSTPKSDEDSEPVLFLFETPGF